MPLRTSTETRLLDAADELFFRQGVAATPIDAVIARAGVSAATLYRGFASKEALLAAALERRHRAWLATWDDAIAAHETPEGRLLAVFDALDAFRAGPLGSRWCAFLGSAAEHADPPAELAEALRRETTDLRGRLVDLARDVDPGHAERLGDQLMLLVTGDLAMRLRTPGWTTDTARATATTLVRG